MADFAERLTLIENRIQTACARAGRSPESVKLLAVSKTHSPETVCEAAQCGITVFGENKVQEAERKIPLCPGNLSWHLIGHLQSNKVKRAVRLFDMIHAADSLKILETIDQACDEAGRNIKTLLEVNVSGEAAKFGLRPDEVESVLDAASSLRRIEIEGLMTMPPFREDPEESRQWFRALAELRERMRAAGYGLPELSMGMSHDFEIAIEEGATWIRVGSALFGARK